jgi:hypothetical protein
MRSRRPTTPAPEYPGQSPVILGARRGRVFGPRTRHSWVIVCTLLIYALSLVLYISYSTDRMFFCSQFGALHISIFDSGSGGSPLFITYGWPDIYVLPRLRNTIGTRSSESITMPMWPLLLFVVGLFYIRRRRDRLSGCRQCAYSLAGLPKGQKVCPECGCSMDLKNQEAH